MHGFIIRVPAHVDTFLDEIYIPFTGKILLDQWVTHYTKMTALRMGRSVPCCYIAAIAVLHVATDTYALDVSWKDNPQEEMY